jgi:hypothetical protein
MLTSEQTIERMQILAHKMLRRLAKQLSKRRGKSTPNDWSLKTIPKFDASSQIMLSKQRQLVFNMFKTTIFEVNSETPSSDLADRFFKNAKIDEDFSSVDVEASILRLQGLITKPRLAASIELSVLNYAMAVKPNATKEQLSEMLERLVLSNYDNLFIQVNKELQSL